MQAYEITALIDGQGNLRLPKECKGVFGKETRIILLVEEDRPERPTPLTFESFAGVLKDSPSFEGDPVAIQRAMRDEWR